MDLLDFWEEQNRIDNVNKIIKEFQGWNWYNELANMSWYNLSGTLSINSISLLDDTLQKLLNKEVVELNEYVLRIVIKYLVFRFERNQVLDIFNFLLLKYDIKFLSEEMSSLVFDETELEYDYGEEPKYKHPLFYLELLFQKDKKDKEFRKEQERKNNEVCIPSFNKYFNQFKDEYGYSYLSPNKTDISSNYGHFLDDIKHVAEKSGIDYDFRIPNTPYIGIESKQRAIWKKKHGEGYFSTVYFLDRTNYTPKISRVVKDLLTPELLDLYIELKIKAEIKRYFLLGGITLDHLFLDYAYKYGFNYYKKHCSPEKWSAYQQDLMLHHNGTYGRLNNCEIKYSAKYIDDNNKEYDIVLVGFSSNDTNDDSMVFPNINSPFPDNIQLHEILNNKELYYEYINSYREPENHIRQLLGLPNIGEGWVSETKLFYLIKEKFKKHRVLQHGKPSWLGKQHLDIYIPELNIGIEYQGKQHTSPVEFFGGNGSFEENKKRDLRKKKLCSENGCLLYEVFPEDDIFVFVDKIYCLHCNDV
jgi:hypothetical protein